MTSGTFCFVEGRPVGPGFDNPFDNPLDVRSPALRAVGKGGQPPVDGFAFAAFTSSASV